MMREILFRGKRLDDETWAEGYVFDDGIEGSNRTFVGRLIITDYKGTYDDKYDVGIDFYEVDPSTTGQYTGQPDMNGAKIFEGDIIRLAYNGIENVFVVIWDEEELDFKATNGKKDYGVGGAQYLGCCEEIEVIGNIHDNPDLLKKV